MRTRTKRIIFLIVLAVILLTAIPSVRIVLSDFTSDIGLTALGDYDDEYEVNIHFISTGISDCIVLNCGDEFILIDGGYYNLYDNVDAYLRQIGVKRFAAVINSHPDADHVGCIPLILANYEVGNLYCSSAAYSSESQFASLMLQTADENNVEVKALQEGNTFDISGFSFEVIAPVESGSVTNDMSLVIKVTKDEFSAIFTGDSTKEALIESAERGHDLHADILKIPHHGSTTSTNAEVLELFDPQYAVLTIGNNSYGLPDPEVLAFFEEKQIPLLRTDASGNIIISSNCDGEYTVRSVYQEDTNEKTYH